MRLAILGASGHGKVIADMALLLGYEDIVFFDDAWPVKTRVSHWRVRGNAQDIQASMTEFDGVIVGIGDNQTRMEKQTLLLASGAPLVTLVHPAAVVSNFVQIGLGSVICAGAVVSVDAIVGDAVVVNTGATVNHDCQLEDGVHIAPGAHLSGDVVVGPGSWIGVGACVRQGVHVGSGVIVGAGAVVVSDIPDRVKIVGNPARIMPD